MSENAETAKATSQRWEYWVTKIDNRDVGEQLNPIGNEGWELVAIHPTAHGHGLQVYFKRPLP